MFQLNFEAIRDGLDAPVDGIMDGKRVAQLVREQVACGTKTLANHGVTPKLAVVLVGDDPASKVYVRHKIRACDETGIESVVVRLAPDISQQQLHEEIHKLSDNDSVDGILVQFPLPAHIDELDAVACIDPLKDVDGFTPQNLGKLMAWRSHLEPCTPRGIITLCRAYGIDPTGKQAVVVGRSMVVGRPMAQMLVRADATVNVCHRNTRDLFGALEEAEILVVATGVKHLIPGHVIREGAIVFDVGITRDSDGKLRGDVDFEHARRRAGLITPVPGGVGPMTVATLLENTLKAACFRRNIEFD